ncbi:MAG: hypothetical protein HYY01_10345 [Chloroflexi bacterium]|nr:hypothetical protein [Chloroflexota bacterium]
MNYSNFNHVLKDLQSLNQAIEEIRQKIVTVNGVSYTSQDARQVALDGLQCDIGACGNWIRVLMSLKCLSQEKYGHDWEEEYRKLIGTGLSSGQAEDLMLDYLRNTVTTKVHFKIENLFSNILKALSASPNRSGFWHISNAMLQRAGIPTTGPEKNTLTVLANLRNSFHANGMHNKCSLRVDIDGIKFEFCKGKPVKSASWKHIVVIMRATISVLESVLFSNGVSNLRSEIPDAFAAADNP